jgi:Rho-related BTB domain-containing protein 1/2
VYHVLIFREIKETDIVPPDHGRTVAKEINAHYYESSVFLNYGIHDVFMNVIRAALIHKREKHFWNQLGGLKNITKPLCQAPFQPPQPLCPKILIQPTTLDHDLLNLFDNQSYADVVFMVQGTAIPAHKSCLAVASPIFEELFLSSHANAPSDVSLTPRTSAILTPHLSDSPLHTSDTANLLDDGDGLINLAVNGALQDALPLREQFPFCTSIMQRCSWESVGMSGMNSLEESTVMVVHLVDYIRADTFRLLLRYLYSDQVLASFENKLSVADLNKLRDLADMLSVKDLCSALTNILKKEGFMNKSILSSVQFQRCQRRRELLVRKSLFSGERSSACIHLHIAEFNLQMLFLNWRMAQSMPTKRF